MTAYSRGVHAALLDKFNGSSFRNLGMNDERSLESKFTDSIAFFVCKERSGNFQSGWVL